MSEQDPKPESSEPVEQPPATEEAKGAAPAETPADEEQKQPAEETVTTEKKQKK